MKAEIENAVKLAQSIRDDLVKTFISDSVPSEIMIQALELTSRLDALVWCLKNDKEGSAV